MLLCVLVHDATAHAETRRRVRRLRECAPTALITASRLRALSHRLEEPALLHAVPTPAAARIPREQTFSDHFKAGWNDGLQGLTTIDRKIADLSRSLTGRQ